MVGPAGPLAGVEIRYAGRTGPPDALTDASGRFALEGSGPVEARSLGFAPATITLEARGPNHVRLRPAAIRLRLVDEDDHPVSVATVRPMFTPDGDPPPEWELPREIQVRSVDGKARIPAPTTGALVTFALAGVVHGSGFLAVYLAGLIVGNSSIRAHNALVAFLDAATWLAQIAMFVLLGLLAWPDLLLRRALPALVIALTLILIARPAAVFLCLAPFRFSMREKLFVSWVGLRGAVGIFLASIPLMVRLPDAQVYFDVAFVVVLISLLVQG